MNPRIENVEQKVPRALPAILKLGAAARGAGIPETTLSMVDLRASQINGCSVCVDIHSRELEVAGEPSQRIHTVAAWREAPYFDDAQLASLVVEIATINAFNRLNVMTRQVGGDWIEQLVRKAA